MLRMRPLYPDRRTLYDWLVTGAERARLCRFEGVRPDPGNDMGRVERGRGGVGGDARLLLVAA